MKKIISLVLIMVLALSLVACGNGKTPQTTAAPPADTTAAPAQTKGPDAEKTDPAAKPTEPQGDTSLKDKKPEDVKIALAVKTLGNPMFVYLKETIEEELNKSGYKLDTFDSQNDAQKEINNVSDIIASGYDVLLITCMDFNASAVVIDDALKNGIMVGVLDSGVENMEKADFSCMSDNVKAGALAMEGLAKHMDGKGKIVVYENALSFATSQRSKGRDEVLKNYPDIEIVNRVNAPLAIDTALNMMDNFLQADPDIKGAWAGNDMGAQGFVAALKAAGKKPGEVGVVATDGNLDSIELIKEGWQTGTSAQFFGRLARTSVETLIKLIKGEKLESQAVLVPVEWIDKTNAADYKQD